jgi:hypothetical protein
MPLSSTLNPASSYRGIYVERTYSSVNGGSSSRATSAVSRISSIPMMISSHAPDTAIRRRPPSTSFISDRHGAKKAAPRKVDVDLIGDPIQLRRKLFYRRLYEQGVGKTTFLRLAMNPLGYLFERLRLSVDPDIELVGIRASAPVDIATVARPYIYDLYACFRTMLSTVLATSSNASIPSSISSTISFHLRTSIALWSPLNSSEIVRR